MTTFSEGHSAGIGPGQTQQSLLGSPITEIVYLPTVQQDETNPWNPNGRGILRIEAAKRCLEENPNAVLVISGGRPNHKGATYSDRMAYYIKKHYPEMLGRLVLISGLHNRTIEDIFQSTLLLAGLCEEQETALVPSATTLYFCSEATHYARTEATIRTLGFTPQLVESGADSSIYSDRDFRLAQEVVPGKLLGLGPEAVEWGRKATENAKAEAEVCQEWADLHPDEDDALASNVELLLHELTARGVYIESPLTTPTRPRPQIPTFLSNDVD